MSTSEGLLDDVGRLFGPDEGGRVSIPLDEIAFDVPDESPDGVEGAPAHRLAGEEAEPRFDQVEPRSPCGREMKPHLRMGSQPRLHGGGIPHGNVPTLAYRVDTRGVSVVFSSDQTGTSPRFVDFARGAHVLIMHLAVAAGTTNHLLHASPAVVGRVAQNAGVGQLILSHIGLFDLDSAIVELKKFYAGPLTIGADLQCTQVR